MDQLRSSDKSLKKVEKRWAELKWTRLKLYCLASSILVQEHLDKAALDNAALAFCRTSVYIPFLANAALLPCFMPHFQF